MIEIPKDYPSDEVDVVLGTLNGTFKGDSACALHSHLVVAYYAQHQSFGGTPSVDVRKSALAQALTKTNHASKLGLAGASSINWLQIAQIVLAIAEQLLNSLLNPPAPPPAPAG